MACCGKRRRSRINEFLRNSKKVLKAFKDADPRKLENKTLLDYHRKCHMLYAGNIIRHPVNKKFINSIVALHNQYVKEILRRKMKHTTPLKKV